MAKPGRPAAPIDGRAREMQARAQAVVASRDLHFRDLASAIGRSPGSVARALKQSPAKRSPTLVDVFNYLCGDADESRVPSLQDLAARSPDAALLIAAIFEEFASVLRDSVNPDKPRKPSH